MYVTRLRPWPKQKKNPDPPRIECRGGSLILTGLPLPVSVNDYANRHRGRKGHYTPKRIELADEFFCWSLGVGAVGRSEAEQFLLGEDKESFYNRTAKTVFTLNLIWKRRMFTKDGKLRKVDNSNYIKAIEDELARWLRIDDCYFANPMVTPRDCTDGNESLTAIITPFENGRL